MRWWLLLGLAACVSPSPYLCERDGDCADGERAGTCEPTGYCSFADPSCPGERRYGGLAGELGGTCLAAGPRLFYVRSDGGSAEECDGRVDVARSDDGHCAWQHPFLALPPGGTPRIAPGDELHVGSGEYRLGIGAPGAEGCPTADPTACTMAPLPPRTKLLGDCAAPPRLVGVGGAVAVVELGESGVVEVACLEITDGAACGRGFVAAPCQPGGDFADTGVRGHGGTGVVLRKLDVHGLAGDGLALVGVKDLLVEDSRIASNGASGLQLYGDGTVPSESVVVAGVVVSDSGCVEAVPATVRPILCAQQPAKGGGYGLVGVVGMSAWTVRDSRFVGNTLQGIDLTVRTGTGSVGLERSEARGNAGIAIALSGAATLENVLVVGDCGAFVGKPYAGNVQACRGDVAVRLTGLAGQAVTLGHVTVFGHGRALLELAGAGTVVARNSIFVGALSVVGNGVNTTFSRLVDGAVLDHDYGILWGAQGTPCPLGAHDLCVDPRLVDDTAATLDGHLLPGSPAIDSGVTSLTMLDRDGRPRPQGAGVDRGAFESSP
jgi:hypothetical protein